MKVWISQIYIKPGVRFPFSHLMQGWVSTELTAVADDCADFQKKYGGDFELGLNLSADTGIVDAKVLGPTVFKRTKDVEYSIFLPFDVIIKEFDGCRVAMEFILAGVRAVFQKVGIDPTKLDDRKAFIIDHVCSDPTMLKEPWPLIRGASPGLH